MRTDHDPEAEAIPKIGLGLEAYVWVPNLLLLLGLVLIGLVGGGGRHQVGPLVATNRSTTELIQQLERRLARNPADGAASIELAQLYQRAGELPFSFEALRSAERRAGENLTFQMKLGMAYLELGKNGDGRRVLREALRRCDLRPKAGRRCGVALRARLSIFLQVADLMVERNINARLQPEAVAKVFDSVLKHVKLPRKLGQGTTRSNPRAGGGVPRPASAPATSAPAPMPSAAPKASPKPPEGAS